MNAFRATGSEPNPHALAALVKASETYAIVASRDIVDVRGMKLWARGQAVSASLHQRLLERRLERPLETCLEAEDGVTVFTLHDDLKAFIESDDHPLGAAVRPWAGELLAQVKHLPLHPVAQLMLTASVASRPGTLPHAVAGMALAGAMMASRGRKGAAAEVRLAMLGGLLHDIGEVYIHPQYLDYTESLDLVGHKHLVVHPRVGQLLLLHLTDYPRPLSTAIGEHHERMDRSGYPARLHADELSELGRLLAVMEVVLGVARWDHAPLSRASFALRVVPGEFDSRWASFICDAAEQAGEDVSSEATAAGVDLDLQLADIDRQLGEARQLAMDMQEQRRTAKVTDVVNHALERLQRLRLAWNALGLWGVPASAEVPAAECFELQLAQAELSQRMRNFQRECLLLSDGLSEAEKFRLSPLWRRLFDSGVR
jgi:hypothetical protein